MYKTHCDTLIQASTEKVEPRCQHFGECGGCRWQQVTYDEQLSIKNKGVYQLFTPLLSETTIVHPPIACTPPWGYRNKMEFSFSQNRRGDKFLGLFMARGRGKVVNLKECPISRDWFIQARNTTFQWWEERDIAAFNPPKGSGSLRTLTLREAFYTQEKMVILTVSGNPEDAIHRSDIEILIASLKENISPNISFFLEIHQAIKGKPTQFYEMHLNGPETILETLTLFDKKFAFKISPSSFFQPNTRQAEKMFSFGINALGLSSQDIVYDLFCGTGTLGILASPFCKEVIGIEQVAQAVLDARDNVELNEINNVRILQGDVHHVLKSASLPPPDVIIVDPPRVGLGEETLRLIALSPARKLLYISCNPQTQVTDITYLQTLGFTLTAMQAVDQFPFTAHIENIAILQREIV